jgi:HK97 family phage prohead protease
MSTLVLQKQIFFTAAGKTEAGEASAIATTPAVDRERDIVVTAGIDLSAFLKNNGPILFAHDHWSIPVGIATRADHDHEQLRVFWKWLPNDAKAAAVRNAWEAKALNSLSIGFLPTAPAIPNEHGGWTFPTSQLLEVSIVPVPANPEATRMLKSFGLLQSPAERLAARLTSVAKSLTDGRTLSDESRRLLETAASNLLTALNDGEEDDEDDAAEKGITVIGPLPDTVPMLADGRLLINEDVINRAVHEAAAQAVEQLTGRLADPYEPIGAVPVIEMSDDALTTLVTGILRTELEAGINAMRGRVD